MSEREVERVADELERGPLKGWFASRNDMRRLAAWHLAAVKREVRRGRGIGRGQDESAAAWGYLFDPQTPRSKPFLGAWADPSKGLAARGNSSGRAVRVRVVCLVHRVARRKGKR